MSTNTTGAITPVETQNPPDALSCWTLTPSPVFRLHTRCYSCPQSLSALLLATHIHQIIQQWIYYTPPNRCLPLGPPYTAMFTRVLFEPHNPLLPLPDHSTSETQHRQISRHTCTSRPRHRASRYSLAFTAHNCPHSRRLLMATLASTKQLPSTRIPLQSAYTRVRAFSVLSSVVLEILGILCLCLSQPPASGRGEKAALRAVALPGAAAPCYTTLKLR
jgi:hypothetical protein